MKKNLRRFVVVLMLFMICNIWAEVINTENSQNTIHLISYEKTGSMMIDDVIHEAQDYRDVSEVAKYDIELYKVIYRSSFEDSSYQLSGLIIVPQVKDIELDLLQYHHGAVFPEYQEQAIPSYYLPGNSINYETSFAAPTMGASGFIVSLPDYYGYGHSSTNEHQFSHHKFMAINSMNMLRASEELIRLLEIDYSERIYLSGWSEGAGAGMAVLKAIQESKSYNPEIILSSFFAGPFMIDQYFLDIAQESDQTQAGNRIFSWLTYSVNEFMLAEKRAPEKIWKLNVQNQKDSYSIEPLVPDSTFQESFLQGIRDGSDEELLQVVKDNSLIEGWHPQTPVTLHYGNKDNIISSKNSTIARDKFSAAGSEIKLVEHDGNHFQPYFDYILQTIEEFKEEKK